MDKCIVKNVEIDNFDIKAFEEIKFYLADPNIKFKRLKFALDEIIDKYERAEVKEIIEIRK